MRGPHPLVDISSNKTTSAGDPEIPRWRKAITTYVE
jgi:hypothetical protein